MSKWSKLFRRRIWIILRIAIAFDVALFFLWVLRVRRWRREAVRRILAAETNDAERAALANVAASHAALVEEARRLHAKGAWPAKDLELDLISTGGGFRAAGNFAGAALVYALEAAGLLAGVPRARGSSGGSYCGLTQLQNTFSTAGLIGWVLRQPRYFKECVGLSLAWRLAIPFEVWYAPSTLHGVLSQGDAARLAERVYIPYVRGRLHGGFQECEVSRFEDNQNIVEACCKSMMMPWLFGCWNGIVGFRDGEIVMDNCFSRTLPVFLDGRRPQLLLKQRKEIESLAPAPLEQMTETLIAGQRDVFQTLRQAGPSGAASGAVELVPANAEAAQLASARLNDWRLVPGRSGHLLRWVRTKLLSEPALMDCSRDAWEAHLAYASITAG